MKIKYKLTLLAFFVEVVILYMMNIYKINIQSFIGKIVAIILLFSPIQYLLYSLSKDKYYSDRKRKYYKLFFWLVNYCVLSIIIGVILAKLG